MKKHPLLISALCAAALLLQPAAATALSVESQGPLAHIDISPTLNCAVTHVDGAQGEFYTNSDVSACGTFVAARGTLYGPAAVPAGGGVSPRTAWEPVSQHRVGTGTAADPLTITSIVEAEGLQLTQVDSYISGESFYRTVSTLENTDSKAVEATLYRAADCYLGGRDQGFGAHDEATGSVSCVAPDAEGNGSSASRIIEFIPDTPRSSYLYGKYMEVWSAVGSQRPLPSTMLGGNALVDNGMGISWTETIPASGSVSFEARTSFSPLDVAALATELSVEQSSIASGGTATVHATITNPNPGPQDLATASVALPAGVDYVEGSASGIAEPAVAEDGVIFTGPAAIQAQGSLPFSFSVTSDTVGTHPLRLTASLASRVEVATSDAHLTVVAEITPDGPVAPPGSDPKPTPTRPKASGGMHRAAPQSAPAASAVDPLKAADAGIATTIPTARKAGASATKKAVSEPTGQTLSMQQQSGAPPAIAAAPTAPSDGNGLPLSLILLLSGAAGAVLLVAAGAVGISASRKAAAPAPIATGEPGSLRTDIIAALGLRPE